MFSYPEKSLTTLIIQLHQSQDGRGSVGKGGGASDGKGGGASDGKGGGASDGKGGGASNGKGGGPSDGKGGGPLDGEGGASANSSSIARIVTILFHRDYDMRILGVVHFMFKSCTFTDDYCCNQVTVISVSSMPSSGSCRS